MSWSISVSSQHKEQLKEQVKELITKQTEIMVAHNADRETVIETIGRFVDAMPTPGPNEMMTVAGRGSANGAYNASGGLDSLLELNMTVRVYLSKT